MAETRRFRCCAVSTPRWRSSTTATAASCPMCYAEFCITDSLRINGLLQTGSAFYNHSFSGLRILEQAMVRVCQLTGTGPMVGTHVSHPTNKTNRRFLPNPHNVTYRSQVEH